VAAADQREEAAQEIGRLLRSALNSLEDVLQRTYVAFPDVLTQEMVMQLVIEAQTQLEQAQLKVKNSMSPEGDEEDYDGPGLTGDTAPH
jgi:glutamate dehydrogenase/leucine dehydrogenase